MRRHTTGPEVVVRTPAKINLALVVGPVRTDRFHELASVYQAVDRYDEIRVWDDPSCGSAGTTVNVSVTGPGSDQVPLGRANLAAQAARLLADQYGIDTGVRIEITKGIPVAGGMAGGSSDAAATLVACDALWRTGLDRAELLALAARLGSDVPFCVLGGTAVGAGHGELVSPLPTEGSYSWVLALDPEGLSTPAMYARLDEWRAGIKVAKPTLPTRLTAALATGDLPAVGRALTNDLQPIAVAARPRLGRVLDSGLEAGALGGLVCGSGPTCAFLAADPDHADRIAERLRESGEIADLTCATGPAPGPRPVVIDSPDR